MIYYLTVFSVYDHMAYLFSILLINNTYKNLSHTSLVKIQLSGNVFVYI